MMLAIALLSLVGVGVIIYRAVVNYRATPGTSWLTAFENSATIAWQRVVMASSFLIAGLAGMADYANAPGVSDAIKACLKPEYVPFIFAGIALITEIARRRRGSSDPL